MTYAGEKRVQRGLAFLLTLAMLLTGFTFPALAEDWQMLTVLLSWTNGAGETVSVQAAPVTWSGTPDFWAYVTPDALAGSMTLSVSDAAGQYTYTTPNGDVLTGVMDAGSAMDGSVLPVTILAMDGSGNTVATYNLYISTQIEMPQEPKPEPKTAEVTVQYMSDDGMVNESETVTVTEGTPYTATARSYEGYDLTSADSVTVEVYADGSISVNPVVFTYAKAYVAPKTAEVIVQYVSDDGMINESETVTVTEGTPYTATARSYEGYDLTSADSVTVEVYADGSISVNPVVFSYAKAYVAPKTAEVTVQYVSDDGMINESETVTVTEGTPYTATARSYEGYDLTSADSVTVEVYADGSISVNPVVFTYAKAYVAPKTAEVTVQYVSDDGMINESETVTVTEGTPYTATARSYEGYDLTSADSVTVEVYADGSINVNPVVFSYAKAYVAPKTAEVTVQYVSDDGMINESETVTVTEGTPYTATARSYEGYDLTSADSVTVEVYADGSINVNPVVFTYAKAYVEPEQPDEPEVPAEPVPATVMVYYRNLEGMNVASAQQKSWTTGTYTITAEPTDLTEGYQLVEGQPASYQVEVYDDGTASVETVTFLYEQVKNEETVAPPTEPDVPAAPISATVNVYYLNEAGERIAQDQQVMLPGDATTAIGVDAALVPAEYDASSAVPVAVSVTSDGVATPAEVTFVFKAIEVEEPDVPVPQGEMINRFGQTVKKGVYVRSEPSTNGKAVDKIAKGTVVYMLRAETGDDGDVWYRVLYAGEQRFIRSDCLEMMTKKDSDAYMAEHYDEPLPEYTKEDLDGTSEPDVPVEPEQPAEPVTVDVMVYYVTEDGQQLDAVAVPASSAAPVVIVPGSDKVPEDYILMSAGSVQVAVDPATGVASPAEVNFIYRVPAPEVKTADVTVVYITEDNVELDRQTVACSSDQAKTITPSSGKTEGYALVSAGSVEITVDAETGALSQSEVRFVYRALAPEIKTVDVPVYYVNEEGEVLDQQTVTCTSAAVTTITANSSKVQGYELTSAGSVQVTVDASTGTAQPEQVTFAYARPGQYTGYALTTQVVALRTEISSSDSSIIQRLEKDTLLYVYNQQYADDGECWSTVQTLDEQPGMVQHSALRTITKEEAQYYIDLWEKENIPETPAEPTQTPPQIVGTAVTVGDGVYFRQAYDTASAILAVLPKDTEVEVLGQAYESTGTAWHSVRYSGTLGFIRADMLRFLTKDGDAESTAQPTIDPSTAMSSYGYITTKNVNFRKEASTSSSRLAQLQKYAMCLVYGTTEVNGKTWYRIKYNNQEGYVSGDYFKHMTISEFTEFLNSDEYREGITNNSTANNNQDNTGNYTGGGVVSEEDKVVDQWTNPNNGLNVSYEPFDPFATPEPITSESPDPSATETATITPSPTLESLPALDVNSPEDNGNEDSGSSWVGIIIAIVLLLLAGGGVYAYVLYNQSKRKAAQRAAQRRAQAAQQQRASAQQRSAQPGQVSQPRTGTYTNQAGTARPTGYQQPQARKPYAPGQSPYQRPANPQSAAGTEGYQRPAGTAETKPQVTAQSPYSRPVSNTATEENTGTQRQGRRAYRREHASQYGDAYDANRSERENISAETKHTDSFN